MATLKDNIHIAFYGDLPVGMFGLFPHETHANTSELMYVYLDKNARGLGFVNQIIAKSKQLAKEQAHTLILLDTLKPKLNHFYEKHGAEVVCENTLFSHPTDVLSISLN
jgi:predicted GNAT family N-acyltransferase